MAFVSVSSWDIGSLTMVYILTTGVNGTNREYIQTFIEKGQAALNWETRLSLLRQAGTQPGKLYTFSISAVYMGLGVVSLVLSICYVFKNKKETRARIVRIAFCVALFILMGIAYQQFNMRLTPKFTQEYREKWEAVQRLEKKNNANP